MKKIFYTILFCLLTGVCAMAQPNLVSNPGFETVEEGFPVDWASMKEMNAEIETNTVHGGNNSLKITGTKIGINAGFVVQFVPVTPGKRYNLSVWCNIQSYSGSGSVSIAYSFIDEDGNNLNNGGTIVGELSLSSSARGITVRGSSETLNTWQQLTLGPEFDDEFVPANAVYLAVVLGTGRTMTACFDDVTVTEEVGAVAKQDQTISGLSDISKTTIDVDFELSATASSSLAVSYTSSNTEVATISGSTVHIVGAGTTVITASQAGNDDYNAAPDVTATLTVNAAPVVKQDQTITGLVLLTKRVGDESFELTATASSGLPVSYTSSNAAVATISGSTVTIVGAGETTITASQAGNDEWNPAPDVTATLTVDYKAGIDDVKKASLPVRIEGDRLIVSAAAGSRIDVYTAVGSRLQSAVSSGSETVLSGLPKGEVLIVRSGYAVAKVII
jgi:hypothetical protein